MFIVWLHLHDLVVILSGCLHGVVTSLWSGDYDLHGLVMSSWSTDVYSQEKKIDLKENIILELEDKRKHIETERSTIELTGG